MKETDVHAQVGNLMAKEEKQVENVKLNVYKLYCKSFGSLTVITVAAVMMTTMKQPTTIAKMKSINMEEKIWISYTSAASISSCISC